MKCSRLIFDRINQTYSKFDYFQDYRKEGQWLRRGLAVHEWMLWVGHSTAAAGSQECKSEEQSTVLGFGFQQLLYRTCFLKDCQAYPMNVVCQEIL